MTEDPRQTRRNGSDPRTAQSKSAKSGEGPLVMSCLITSRSSRCLEAALDTALLFLRDGES